MTKHPTSRHVPHAAGDSDDVFVVRMLELNAWAKKHSRALVIGGVLIVIAAVATWQYVEYRGAMSERAAVELLTVRGTAASGNYALAIRDLEAYLERFGDTPSASEARILLGQLYLAQSQPEQAIEALQGVQDGGHLLSTAAGLLLAGAYEAAGQMQQAEATYLAVAEEARLDYQRREALEDAARVRAQAGDTAGAVELYDRLIGMVQDNPAERSIYEMRRAELTADGIVAPAS